MPTPKKSFDSSIDTRLLSIDPENYPSILRIGCGHPRVANITVMGDRHEHWLCLSAECCRIWADLDRFA
jgi:hypothetical protein